MRNAMTLEKAAVYAVSQDTALTRLSAEYDALFTQKRFGDAHGVALAMRIIRSLDLHILTQKEWRESRR